MSERPPFEFRRTPGAEYSANPRTPNGTASGGDDRGIEDSDSIWDPEIKAGERTAPKGPLATLPSRASALPDGAADIERPTPLLRKISRAPPLSDVTFLHALPQRGDRRSGSTLLSFIFCVLLPVIVATYYYGRVASRQYSAEFHFTVKEASSSQSASAAGASSGILSMLGMAGNTNTNNYIVVDYLTSRQIVDALQKRIDVTALYSKPEIDWWSRFNALLPIERFMRYWRSVITTSFDQVTGIATAEVRAFSPDDAFLVANTLVQLSEELVNEIAARTQKDAVRFAQAEVEKAEQRLKQVRDRMTEYRNRSGVIDPNTSVVASSANLVQTLRATLAQQEAQLATMLRQNLVPTAPAVVVIKNQIQSTKEQLDQVARSVATSPDGKALSKVMGEYEQLDLDRQFAQTMMTGALQALDQARASAAAQHLYITPYIRPSVPTTSLYPNRIVSVAYVGIIAFVLWLIALLMMRSIRERFA